MNIEKEIEKKEYVRPQMTVVEMERVSLLCDSCEESDPYDDENWDDFTNLN